MLSNGSSERERQLNQIRSGNPDKPIRRRYYIGDFFGPLYGARRGRGIIGAALVPKIGLDAMDPWVLPALAMARRIL